jgi:phage RecT family recombinase
MAQPVTKTVQPKPPSRAEHLTKLYDTVEKTLEACQPMLTPEITKRLHAVVWQQIRTSEPLQACTTDSIYTAVHRMASLGLDPSVPNEAWLVAYKNEATLITGFGGLRKLALQSPDVVDVWAEAVHENDVYESNGPVQRPLHKLPPKFAPRGRPIGYYACAALRSGLDRVVEMSIDEVRKHRDRYSRAAQSQFWEETTFTAQGQIQRKGSFDQMAKKTVLRQLCHPRNLSLTPAAQAALRAEDVLLPQPPPVLQPVSWLLDTPSEQAKSPEQHTADIFGGEPSDYQRVGKAGTAQEEEGVNPITGEIVEQGQDWDAEASARLDQEVATKQGGTLL